MKRWAGLPAIGMVMHHDGSLRLAGMVVDNSLKVVFGRDDAEPVGSDNQKIGIHKRQVTNHSLEVVAAMTAENNQLAHALCIEGGNYVFQNGLLGGEVGEALNGSRPGKSVLMYLASGYI